MERRDRWLEIAVEVIAAAVLTALCSNWIFPPTQVETPPTETATESTALHSEQDVQEEIVKFVNNYKEKRDAKNAMFTDD